MRIKEVTADVVLKMARAQRLISREEFLKRAGDCFHGEVYDALKRFADSYRTGEEIDINMAPVRQAYRKMAGADGPPVRVSGLYFR